MMFRVAWRRPSVVLRVSSLRTSTCSATANGHESDGHTLHNDYSLLAYYFDIRASLLDRTRLTDRQARGFVDRSGFFSFAMTADQVRVFTDNEPFQYADLIIHDIIDDLRDMGTRVDIMKKTNSSGMRFRISKEAKECWQLDFDLQSRNEIGTFSNLIQRYKPRRDEKETFYGVMPRSNLGEGDLSFCRQQDFSPRKIQGIYVTKLISVAKKWALELEEAFGKYQVTVVAYTLPPGWRQSFNGKVFRDGKFVEWQRFVTLAKAGRNDHRYDFVEGPFLNTMLVPEHARRRDTVFPAGHQLAVFRPGLLKMFVDTVEDYGEP